MTHRQHLMWQLWLEQQWNKPDRHDHYSMRIAEEVGKCFKVLAKEKGYFDTIDKFKVKFTEPSKEEPVKELSDEYKARLTAEAKARWRPAVNASKTKK